VHEVLMSYKLAILVDNADGHDRVVLVNLMHESTHDNKSFSIRNDVFFLILFTLLAGLLLLLLLLTVFITISNRERTNHELFSVDILALFDNKILSLILDLIFDFLDNFFLEDFNEILQNFLTHDVVFFFGLVNR